MGSGGMSNSGRSSNKSRALSSPQVMKITTTCSSVEEGMMTPAIVEGSNGKVILQEEKEIIAFARRLAANEKRDRDQALKRLEGWMTKHKLLSEKDLLKIWKGLFYCMWMSDKAQVQQELGRAISRLVHCFGPDLARAHLFVATFYRTVRREWTGLDQHRLDKFYSFMRSMLRECLTFAQQRDWSSEALAAVVLPLDAEVLVQPWPNGLRLHMCDLIIPELVKVGGAGLTTAQALAVLQPFLVAMATSADKVVAERARARVLLDLIEAKRKQRTKGEAMDEDNEGEDGASMLNGVDLEALQATVFDLAAATETREKYRAGLYDAHKGLQGLTGKKRASAAKAVIVSLPKPSATPVGRKGKKAGREGEEGEEEEEEEGWMDEDEDGSNEEGGEDNSEEEDQEEAEQEEEEEEDSHAAPAKDCKKRKAQEEIVPVKQQQKEKGWKKKGMVDSKKAKKEGKPMASPTLTPASSESNLAKGALGDKAEKKTQLSKKGGKEEATTTTKKNVMPPATQPSETKSSNSKRNAEKEKALAMMSAAKKIGGLEQGIKRKGAVVDVPAEGKEEEATTGKTAAVAAAKKTKVMVNGTATRQAAPASENMKKQSLTAAAPTAPAAEPTFIPSKKFAGGKGGYVFKKGRQGVGYYIDSVQRGGGAMPSVGRAGNAGSNKKVRWGKVQVKLFNKNASPADGKGKNTVSFMGGGAAGGGTGKQSRRGGRGGEGRGGVTQHNKNRRKAVSYF